MKKKNKLEISKLALRAEPLPEGYLEIRFNQGDEEARSRLKTMQKADEMAVTLDDIYNKCRSIIKHGSDGWTESQLEILEEIKSMAGEFNNL